LRSAEKVPFANQGDQIGRFFAQRVIVYFGQFFLMTKVAYILGYFSPQLRLCNDFDKK
jgi:uncharacterized membrane protein